MKEYPIYNVLAYVWNSKKAKIDNGYDLVTLFESNDKYDAFDFLSNIDITADVPEARLEIDYGDCIDVLFTKDEQGLFATY